MTLPTHNPQAEPKLLLLQRWQTNCLRSQIANYRAASRYKFRNYLLGVPVIVLTAIVGTSVFASIGESADPTLQIIVGLVSVTATVLAGLQTFFRWGELASKFKATAVEYGVLKREIDQLLVTEGSVAGITDFALNKIREQMDTLSRDAPDLPDDIWKDARKQVPLKAQSTSL